MCLSTMPPFFIRHIDAQASNKGLVKLLNATRASYTATEAGQDLMQVAAMTDDRRSTSWRRISAAKACQA
jgi:hypothetical protein